MATIHTDNYFNRKKYLDHTNLQTK